MCKAMFHIFITSILCASPEEAHPSLKEFLARCSTAESSLSVNGTDSISVTLSAGSTEPGIIQLSR